MKAYNHEKPLFSLHVPKCAGQSLRRLLQGWFGPGFQTHYFQRRNALPPRLELGPGACLHGHFNNKKGMGVDEHYPDADQYLTVLRDPLEIATSNYFYWKHKSRRQQIALGQIREGGEHDYRSIDDFFRKRSRSHVFNFLPASMTKENYREFLEQRFVWVGLTENLDAVVPVLAGRLGFAPAAIEHINVSSCDEELSPALREVFIRDNHSEFELVDWVRKMWPVARIELGYQGREETRG